MKKVPLILFALMLFGLAGCVYAKSANGDKGKLPYGSLYDDAKDWATYWCGPCEQISVQVVPDEPHDKEYYVMKDLEYGFEYQVSALYIDYAYSSKPEPSYSYGDFDYRLLQVFLDGTDFSDLIDQYDLTVEIEEIRRGADQILYDPFYSPKINFRTERELSDEEVNDILGFTYYALQKFDEPRGHFSRNEYCKTVYFYVWCAPSEKDKSLGRKYGGSHGVFGYNTEHRKQ